MSTLTNITFRYFNAGIFLGFSILQVAQWILSRILDVRDYLREQKMKYMVAIQQEDQGGKTKKSHELF